MPSRLLIRFRTAHTPSHVHVDVFAGPDADHLSLAGDLVFRHNEWALLRSALRHGASVAVSPLLGGGLDTASILIEGDQ